MTEPVEGTGPVPGSVKESVKEKELDQSASAAAYRPAAADGHDRRGRFWSKRRIPAGLLAVVVAAGTGLLLYDVVAVRAERPAMAWRRSLADQLERWPLDNTWVLVGAGVAMALGVWLMVLAVTPGLRGLLPMRRDAADKDVRAGLDREAAALVLRDRATEVSGVQSVRVRMGRRRVGVRAVSHFRELDDVRADMDAVLGAAIRELGLAHPPALSVVVRRPAKKG
ncbi:DUF6286 domain-containing protein [Streptomyces sp. NPDC059909]|uniref:DUF6286 domain-containing protein n=1 Tax=Streptomyces sp. NPDC059909 TaxID=3346998 RepID=UPI00365286A0